MMNILMIEDNHSVCEMMAMFLKKYFMISRSN